MKNNAAIYAILNLLAISVGFALVCLFVHDLQVGSFEKGRILATSTLAYFLAATFIYLGFKEQEKKLLDETEQVSSKLLSVLDKQVASEPQILNLSLLEISEQVVQLVQNLKQGQRAIVDFSRELVCVLDADLRIIDINVNAEKIWLHQNASIIGACIIDFVAASDKERSRSYFVSARNETLAPLENRVSDQNGRTLDFSWVVEWSASKSAYFCVVTDISAEKEIERLRAEITSMVSHDLRAPISSLSYFVDGLIAGEFGALNEIGRKQVSKLKDSLQQVLRLINQLLDAENLDSGTMQVQIKVVPAAAVVEASQALLQSLAEQKFVKIVCDDSDELLFADFDRTVQVLNNLLSNAIKFSPENSKIKIKIVENLGAVRFEVVDEGPGLSAENCSVVFERFKTLEHQSSSSHGLGLYISKKLLELQGGSIGVQSTPGKGAKFWFELKQATEDDLPGYLDEADSADLSDEPGAPDS